ncbi:uncharacterized protein (TIGR02118 family) [Dyadobacter jejuensis]|uniref:Uncharacterized protein (TIGR02118 family) n=1 Tax=Dyadobacter jejuensis TaxID=1082580 RepID=A0A316AID9_9BACT|nr:EthD family reductase [Dyadobacter jejuensis]PWJ57009.1 uncharacterized protein (TIGR02118 family) [Dyadobacter jejuensis]
MIKLTVLYPNVADLKFDKDYYIEKHGPLLTDLLGDALKSVDVNMGLSGVSPDQPAPYVVITNLTFDSLESFQGSFGVHAEKILADLPNFTNVQPVVQISEAV